MKYLYFVGFILFFFNKSLAQGGNPSNFGIEGELSANQPATGIDDWFKYTAGTGLGVIDTAGASAIRSAIISNTNYTFTKRMAFPTYSLQNSKLFIDALYARDYNSNGGERTVMLGNKTKNGANPMTQWEGGPGNVGGGANDIIDMYAHARRDGSSITNNLWVYGAITYGFTGGSHYFDYEFYQSPISFVEVAPPANGYFTNSGNDEGHTAWRFLPDGTLVSVGDVAVAVGFNGTTVTSMEVRLWVRETDYLTIAPTTFSWTGSFDKLANSNQYGYASINVPASAFLFQINTGATAIPAAPWGTVRSGGHFENTYEQSKFLEFALNFTALGVDNQLISGQDPCAAPFRRLMVKSRTGSSFTGDLKDFLGPYDFLNISAPQAAAGPDATMCPGSTSLLSVTIPPGTYGYFNWTSQSGTGITSNPDSSAIYVDALGTYYVQSYVYPGCPAGSRDTIQVLSSSGCFIVLDANILNFKAILNENKGLISWQFENVAAVKSFSLEKSTDGINFLSCYNKDIRGISNSKSFEFSDEKLVNGANYYRLRVDYMNGALQYSSIKQLRAEMTESCTVRQVYGTQQILVHSTKPDLYILDIMDADGKKVYSQKLNMTDTQISVELNKLSRNRIYYYRLSNQKGENITGKLMF